MKNYLLIIVSAVCIVTSYADDAESRAYERAITLREQNSSSALNSMKQFRTRYPQSDYADEALWAIAELSPDYYETVSSYGLFIQQYPQHPYAAEAHWRMAQLYYLHSNYSEAAQHLNDIITQYSNSKYVDEAHYWLGIISSERNQFVNAEEMFKYCIDRNTPFKQWAQLGLANNLYLQNDLAGATTMYIGVCGSASDKGVLVPAIYNLGEIYFRAQNYSNALYCYDLMTKYFPQSIEGEKSSAQARLLRSRHASLRPAAPSGLRFKIDLGSANDGVPPSFTAQPPTAVAASTAASSTPSTTRQNTTAAQTTIPTSGYSVQVGAFRTQTQADQERSRFESMGFQNVFVVSGTVNDTVWYRVRIGSFASRDAAQTEASRIAAAQHCETRVVSN